MSASKDAKTLEGGCDCGKSRYQLTGRPIFVNCCHCRWCQRETGSAFAINAMYEADRFQLVTGDTLEETALPTESDKPQRVYRCPSCKVVLYGLYGDNGDYVRFIKVGTLTNPDELPPMAHVFTMSKQPWFKLEDGAPQFREYYKRSEVWPKESLDRIASIGARIKSDRDASVNDLADKTAKTKL